MKWIVVKLSGDAARPAYETGDDTITIRTASECPAVANLHQGRRDRKRSSCWAGSYKGLASALQGQPEQIEAKSRHQFSFLSN